MALKPSESAVVDRDGLRYESRPERTLTTDALRHRHAVELEMERDALRERVAELEAESEAWEKASVARFLKRNAELTSNVVELVKAATQARSAISRGLYSVAAKRLDPYAAWDEDADGYEQF